MISQNTIDNIKETARIEEVVGEFVSLKKDGPRMKGLCPFHNENTPSFSVTPAKNIFKCFGCGESGDSITFIMKHEKKTYPEALRYLADKYSITIEDSKGNFIDPVKCKPDIRQRDATPEEQDGVWSFETKEFDEADIRFVLADKVWDYLLKTANRIEEDRTKEFKQEERLQSAINRAREVFSKYHFHCLTSYTIVKNRKATTIRATPDFPIYFFDEGDWKKIYKPMEPEKKNRFMYYGKRPHDFIHGLDVIGKAYAELEKKRMADDEMDDDEDDNKKKAPEKLNEVIYCSGGSDGLNLAMLNLYPFWMNSESQKLTGTTVNNLLTKAKKIYHVPDIDKTGTRLAHELAMEHLDIHTLYLPYELKLKSVARGKGKDVRDYFRFWTAWDFLSLMKTAYPYRFWDRQPQYNKKGEYIGMKYQVRGKYMLNFLSRNGFFRFKSEGQKDGYIYIHINHNIVRKVEAKDIRDFINAFLEDRRMDAELMDVFLFTTKLNESAISNLPFIELDFTDYDKHTQWMFFSNSVFKINAAGIEELSPRDCDKLVWEDEVLSHEAEKLDDFFTITHTVDYGFDITIHNKRCLALRYLINASRIHWREELETRVDGFTDKNEQLKYIQMQGFSKAQEKLADGLPKEQRDKYREDHKWDIAGPLLTPEEQQEQKLHLINKIYALGYLLHRYKNSSRAWCVWAMDNKITDTNESHGGSGKSISMKLLMNFMKTEYIEGRNQKITDNPHIWGNITRHTDFIFIDDCSPWLKFDFFYPSITGPMNCNPKNAAQYTIPFQDVGKMGFAANYTPNEIDPSAERRILYMVFSDYYHYSRFGEYREERRVFDDFGKNLIDDFNEEDWNYVSNFLAQCIRFYLSASIKINPPMDNVNKRNLKREMGDAFQAWADVFFSEKDKFDKFLVREELFEDFRSKTKQQFTPQKFLKSIKAWCHYHGHEFNPKEHQNNEGRIVRKVKHKNASGVEEEKSAEVFFIKCTDRLAEEPEAAGTIAADQEEKDLPF